MLRGISKVDTTVEILGQQIDLPICIAPAAMQKMAHPDGEIGTAKGTYFFIKSFFSCKISFNNSSIYTEIVISSNE